MKRRDRTPRRHLRSGIPTQTLCGQVAEGPGRVLLAYRREDATCGSCARIRGESVARIAPRRMRRWKRYGALHQQCSPAAFDALGSRASDLAARIYERTERFNRATPTDLERHRWLVAYMREADALAEGMRARRAQGAQ